MFASHYTLKELKLEKHSKPVILCIAMIFLSAILVGLFGNEWCCTCRACMFAPTRCLHWKLAEDIYICFSARPLYNLFFLLLLNRLLNLHLCFIQSTEFTFPFDFFENSQTFFLLDLLNALPARTDWIFSGALERDDWNQKRGQKRGTKKERDQKHDDANK